MVTIDLDGLVTFVGSRRVGLITGPSAWTATQGYVLDVLTRQTRLVALFSPEHGLWGQAQAGVPVSASTDARTRLPAYSLYGEHQAPTAEMLADVDVLVFCMQDAGCRYYTYKTTLARCLRKAAEQGLPFVVLDRPTPLRGDVVQGNTGRGPWFPLALSTRYGMTLGELATWLNTDGSCELTVLPARGWTRSQWFDDTGLEWVAPSPNLPTLTSTLVFTCTGVLEGTNVSEGRGTTRPFELMGAPWLDGFALAEEMNGRDLPGVTFRPAYFEPSFSKYAGEVCGGVQVHVLDRDTFDPVRTCFWLLDSLRRLHADEFEIRPAALDARFGAVWVREGLQAGESPEKMAERCREEAAAFGRAREGFLLYSP